ncbi:unnamed protein product, partial [Medioppia subpectinata]
MTQHMKHMKTSLETTDDGNEDKQQAKNSMDRFGDDLCALIVSYLSFEDRFRYECVSKQFQRTVFESVVDLTVEQRLMRQQKTRFSPNIELLTTIAKKCPNIQCIDFRGISPRDGTHIPEVLKRLRLIITEAVDEELLEPLKLCHRLTHLTLILHNMSEKLLDNCGKHWPRLHYLSIECLNFYTECLDHILSLPALQTVVFKYFQSEGLRDNAFEYFVSKATKLKKIEMNMEQQTKHKKTSLETTDDGNEDNIQHAMIYAKNSMDRFGDDLCALLVSYLHIEDCFKYESVSKQFQRTVFGSVVCIDFNDHFIQREDDISIFKTMNKIIKKCRNIQTIDFCFIEENNKYFLEVLAEILREFPNLREIYCNLSSNSNRWIRELAPLITLIGDIEMEAKESLIHCHRLSHLTDSDLSHVFDTTSGQLLAKNLLSFGLNGSHNNQQLSEFVSGNQSLTYMEQQTKHKKTSLETTDDGNEDNIQQPQMYAKNSMDRFGDDLCALLVSHLSIKDRFRLECVSKQFQRTVFRSVVCIDFSDYFIQRQDFPIFTTMNKIIKKCRNIQTIDFCDIHEN